MKAQIEYISISEVIEINNRAGQFYFSPATLNFFKSRLDPGAFRLPDGQLIFTESVAAEWGVNAGPERVYLTNAMHPETGEVTRIAEYKSAGARNKGLITFLQGYKGGQ